MSCADFLRATLVTIRREWLSHRLNRFLHWHLGLLILIGVMALFISPEEDARGVLWFVFYAVLYVIALSSVLLGFSSAQAEAEETPFLLTQPTGLVPWIAGKVIGLSALVVPASALLIVPWWVANGWSAALGLLALASAGLCAVLTVGGLAVGLWVKDPVRGLIAAVALWLVGLFAADLILLLTAGSGWAQTHPSLWVLPMMMNPFDALRVMVLLVAERSAYNTLGAGKLVLWWTQNAGLWLAICLLAWGLLVWWLALVGARHQRRT